MGKFQHQQGAVRELMALVVRLQRVLENVAERHVDGDPLPCFCVEYEPAAPEHNAWCSEARATLADAARISGAADGQ